LSAVEAPAAWRWGEHQIAKSAPPQSGRSDSALPNAHASLVVLPSGRQGGRRQNSLPLWIASAPSENGGESPPACRDCTLQVAAKACLDLANTLQLCNHCSSNANSSKVSAMGTDHDLRLLFLRNIQQRCCGFQRLFRPASCIVCVFVCPQRNSRYRVPRGRPKDGVISVHMDMAVQWAAACGAGRGMRQSWPWGCWRMQSAALKVEAEQFR